MRIFFLICILVLSSIFAPKSDAVVVNVNKIPCKDGYQIVIEYSDGTSEEYFQSDLDAIEELK